MIFEKSAALELAALNQAAYAFANTGICTLPAGFSAPVAIRLPASDRPLLLKRDNLDIFGFCTSKDDVIHVVFRGTQILSGVDFGAEWALDALSLPMARLGSGNVHLGFYEAWKSLRQATMEAMGSFQINAGRIITGHSLGAAIATLCWADLGGELLTFASPRVGDPKFANGLWSGKTVRVVNAPDIVPDVPVDIGGPMSLFRHGGTEVRVNGPGGGFNWHVAHNLTSYIAGINNLT